MPSAEDATPIEGSKNISLSVEGSVMYVFCDLSKDFGESTSGKSIIIGSTSGNKPLGKSGASLGVNIFVKDITKRDLTSSAVAALRTEAFQPCSEGCEWRIDEDGVTLCVRIDFAAVKEREAGSGKTVLLATSGSFKAVAKTGILFNLNCYRQKDGGFDVTKIAEDPATGVRLAAGDPATTTEEGFTLHYRSTTEAVITFTGRADAFGETASLKDCRLDNITVTLHISPLKAKRAKVEGEGSDSPTARTAAAGGLLHAPAEKLRNLHVTCGDGDAGCGDFTVSLRFDPSLSFGRSASGKSLTVGTSAGFQVVSGPDGQPRCRLQFNAYRPAPPIGEKEVREAVEKVLGKRDPSELPELRFKAVKADVVEELGASASQAESLDSSVKSAIVEYIRSNPTSQTS